MLSFWGFCLLNISVCQSLMNNQQIIKKKIMMVVVICSACAAERSCCKNTLQKCKNRTFCLKEPSDITSRVTSISRASRNTILWMWDYAMPNSISGNRRSLTSWRTLSTTSSECEVLLWMLVWWRLARCVTVSQNMFNMRLTSSPATAHTNTTFSRHFP